MATSIGKWSEKRVTTVSEHIIGYLLERNRWLDRENQSLETFKPSEQVEIQYMIAKGFSDAVMPYAAESGWSFEEFTGLLSRFEGGLDASGISIRLLDLRKPFLYLSKKQITLFVRRYIPKRIVEESVNRFCLVEFQVNGYRKELPTEWRKITQDN